MVLWFYLITIIFFACLFRLYSKDFYQSTSSREAHCIDLKNQISNEMLSVTKSFFKNLFENNLFNIDIDSIRIFGPEYNNGSVKFVVFYNSRVPRSWSRQRHRQIWEIYIPRLEPTYQNPQIEYFLVISNLSKSACLNIQYRPSQPLGEDKTIGPVRGRLVHSDDKEPYGIMDGTITVDAALSNCIEQFYHLQEGSASYKEGNFYRFLYLSIITITTLGFGDIVPTTPTTRFLVGLESILGIIIMGIFVGVATSSNRTQ